MREWNRTEEAPAGPATWRPTISGEGNASAWRIAIRKRPWLINVGLFVITAVTTTAVGATYSDEPAHSWLDFFLNGWVFSVPLMTILLVHEMGHFLTGRRHRLDVSPPYFLPAIWPLGTFGAFIKIRSPIMNRKVLVEVGASGPIAGAVVAIPLLLVGLYLSQIQPGGETVREGLVFGSSIILELLSLIRFGHFSSSAHIILHPTALAAWFGLFVTAMNLLPMGQLDGGHVIYALFGPRRARTISVLTFLCLIPLGLMFWLGWLVFAAITLFVGLRHPPPLDPDTPLDASGCLLGYGAVLLFILTFIPVPIAFLG